MKAEEFYKNKGDQFKKLLHPHQYRALCRFTEVFANQQNKELIENHNELLETHEHIKQQNIDVHNEWKELNEENEKFQSQLKKERNAKFEELNKCEVICFNDGDDRHYFWKDYRDNIFHRVIYPEKLISPIDNTKTNKK